MRTTVTIDDDLLADAKAFAARQRRTLSDVVQDALRHAVSADLSPRPSNVELPTFGDAGDGPLVDILDKEALAEVLGDNDFPRRDDDVDS